jgi:hypothetical protein
MALLGTDQIKTGPESSAEVKRLIDGLTVKIKENTQFEILSISGEFESHVKVHEGTIICNAKKLVSKTMTFSTPTATAAIRGTMFSLGYTSGISELKVFKGVVEFSAMGQSMNVLAGNSAVLSGSEISRMMVPAEEQKKAEEDNAAEESSDEESDKAQENKEGESEEKTEEKSEEQAPEEPAQEESKEPEQPSAPEGSNSPDNGPGDLGNLGGMGLNNSFSGSFNFSSAQSTLSDLFSINQTLNNVGGGPDGTLKPVPKITAKIVIHLYAE